MKQFPIALFLLGCLLGTPTLSQETENLETAKLQKGSPEWIVDKFFSQKSFPEYKDYVGGDEEDYIEQAPSLGSTLPDGASVSYRALEETSERAVYAVLVEGTDFSWDLYCHLFKAEESWKIGAIRSLALTGLCQYMIDSLQSETNPSDTAEFWLESCRLQTGSDIKLKDYLRGNLDKFTEIVNTLATDENFSSVHWDDSKLRPGEPISPSYARIKELLWELHLWSAERAYEGTKVMIGGIMDNTVYYLHLGEGRQPPAMDPKEYIYVEEVLPGWYLIKTT